MGDTEMEGKTIYRPHIFIEGFEYMRTLGVGGFASTHLFRDIKGQYGKFIAIKVPHDKEREEALIRGDIFSLPALRDCPYIAKILDVRCIKGRYVLLMEYVDGPLLRDLLGEIGSVAKLPIEKALKYAIHVAKGLDTAHQQQMVHRDIKPENIIINQSNDTAKILDFGIASLMGRKGHFKTSLRRYTAFYSPGEILFHGKGDQRVDIYSLGVTLYEMLTGSLPFYEAEATDFRLAELVREGHAKPPKELNPEIPAYVEEAILKAISSGQNDRFQHMRAFIAALEPPPELKMADHHFQAGAIRRAEHILRSLIGRRPNDARGYIALASLLNRCHRPAEAKEALVRAINLEPKDAGLHMQMSLTLDQLGEKKEAKQLLARAERLCTDKRMLRHIQKLRDKMENL